MLWSYANWSLAKCETQLNPCIKKLLGTSEKKGTKSPFKREFGIDPQFVSDHSIMSVPCSFLMRSFDRILLIPQCFFFAIIRHYRFLCSFYLRSLTIYFYAPDFITDNAPLWSPFYYIYCIETNSTPNKKTTPSTVLTTVLLILELSYWVLCVIWGRAQ